MKIINVTLLTVLGILFLYISNLKLYNEDAVGKTIFQFAGIGLLILGFYYTQLI